MGRFNTVLMAGSAAMLFTTGAAAGQGVVPDRSTIVTISAPVSVPGVVLPAGEYLFKLAESQANRNIVQIFDKDRTRIFATLLAVAAERNEPEGDAVVTFRESPANEPPALRFWYYAGEKQGQEFVYPKSQARSIARASGEAVMSTDTAATDAESMQKAEMARVDGKAADVAIAEPAPAETMAAPVEPPSAAPLSAPVVQAPASTEPTGTSGREVMPAAAGTSGAAPAEAPGELPRTASTLPLVGVLGFLALAAAMGVRSYRRRMVV